MSTKVSLEMLFLIECMIRMIPEKSVVDCGLIDIQTRKHNQVRYRFFLDVESNIFLIFSVCAPQYVMLPPLQSTCHYIKNHHVKKWHVRLGGANNMHPLSWGGHKRKRSLFWKWWKSDWKVSCSNKYSCSEKFLHSGRNWIELSKMNSVIAEDHEQIKQIISTWSVGCKYQGLGNQKAKVKIWSTVN